MRSLRKRREKETGRKCYRNKRKWGGCDTLWNPRKEKNIKGCRKVENDKE